MGRSYADIKRDLWENLAGKYGIAPQDIAFAVKGNPGGLVFSYAPQPLTGQNNGAKFKNGAFKFNGTSDYIDLGSDAALCPGSLIVIAGLKISQSAYAENSWQPIIERDYTNVAEPFYTYRFLVGRLSQEGLGLRIYFTLDGTRREISITDTNASGDDIVAGFKITDGLQQVFKNGEIIGTGTFSGALSDYSTPTYIGKSQIIANNHLTTDRLDSVIGFNNPKITAATIKRISTNFNQLWEPRANPIFFDQAQSGLLPINLLDGKLIIKNSATNLLDGKVQIKNISSDILDGLVGIKDSGINIFDGSVAVKDVAISLLDGKLQILNKDTDVFDSKIVIQNIAQNLLDGNITIKNSSELDIDSIMTVRSSTTDLLDGVVNILESSTNLLDGKIIVGSLGSGSDLLDGLIAVKDVSTNFLDGLIIIQEEASSDLDGKLIIKNSAELNLDGKITIKDISTNLLDGKIQIKTDALNLLDGKLDITSAGINLLDGKINFKDSTTVVLDGKISIETGSVVNFLDGRITITELANGKVRVFFSMITPSLSYELKTPNTQYEIN